MTDNTNPGNFANRPTEEVKEIAAKGGRASGGTGGSSDTSSGNSGSGSSGGDVSSEGRNPDGTFQKGSQAAKEAGAKGGHSS
ncbi:hypothetical protein W97_08225 [Coniosporium apollinis CBS 100218]|uniref:Conidiation-specific protein 10 n=1 Tax=Coniosporium apollinis (strain CBS 100218) TaxID=1168221 RepID=R7Z476_CONA1|nr:uncharacterized protein W97_08225 [Coniosporium apollinis CBS 100218]EON68967.1 hypothetical protein W97_08225 [Coniosporium apollinis CBS 100218]